MNDVADNASGLDEDKDRNFITALARGLDILRCFEPGDVMLTNQDFAARTGLPKPTISRLTHTLCALDYLIADARIGTYRLGPGVLRLGFGVLAGMEMTDRARDVMRGLARGPNSYITVALAEAHQTEAIYVAVERSRENVSLTMHVGARLPLFASAIGRAILVGSAPQDREAMFARAEAEDPGGDAARRESLAAAQAEFDAVGYCSSYGAWRADVNGIAVPIKALSGSTVYGLNVGGPSFHVKRKQLEGIYAGLLLDAAKGLGRPG